MQTNVYVDGFNLYYRALKDTPFRWLNLRQLSESLFPQDSINKLCYFTALISERPGNPGQASRQLTYLRALETLPGIDIQFGTFRTRAKRRPLVQPLPGQSAFVEVLDSEEKGSDVNLATQLLVDGFKKEYEQAVVLSNDSDFAGAMRYVRDELRLNVTLVNPDPRRESPRHLAASASYVRRLWRRHLRESQFPESLADETGTIVKPTGW